MKISIITPSYNQGPFVGQCIRSVRLQQGVCLEHIILDNCSSDGTENELRSYLMQSSAVDVKVFIERDKGQTDAINRGFRMATGDIVCWLNTDEYYMSGVLQRVAEYFTEHPEVDVLFGDCNFVNMEGKLTKKKREYFFSSSMLLYYGCYIPSCATFIRRRVIDEGLLLNPEFKVAMDFDWYVRLAKAGYRFVHLPLTLASFTWHETNISSNFVERRMIDRRLVQDRYSGVRGPDWFRSFIYAAIRYFWLAVRVTRRFVG